MTRRPLDYETTQVHYITVQVKDGNHSLTVNQSFTIYVTNVNEAPTSIVLSNHVIAENAPTGTLVGIINVTDPDEAFVPQSITCGLRNDAGGRFKVSGLALTVLDSRMLNFEDPDGPDHLVDIECQDQDGEATQQQFVVELTNVDEPPIRIESTSGKFEVFYGSSFPRLCLWPKVVLQSHSGNSEGLMVKNDRCHGLLGRVIAKIALLFYSTACLNVWRLLLYDYKSFVASYGLNTAADLLSVSQA